jgi:hypothetical protein
MANTKFKVNFTISKSVDTDIDVLKIKILNELKKDDYEIIVRNDVNIDFNNSGTPFFRVRGTPSSKLREGSFTVKKEKNNTLVRLDFRVPFLLLLIAFATLFFLGFLWGWGVLFIMGILIIAFISEVLQQKNNAKYLIKSIIDGNS